MRNFLGKWRGSCQRRRTKVCRCLCSSDNDVDIESQRIGAADPPRARVEQEHAHEMFINVVRPAILYITPGKALGAAYPRSIRAMTKVDAPYAGMVRYFVKEFQISL